MKPAPREMQRRVKNTREFDNRVYAAVGAHMKGYRKKNGRQQLDTPY